ncbi:helix-turn-helix transcriptional regulator [Patescibacteria group bacterium]|nr:helix-turn-helix transcriptional regulator [Patescibacteria group bacterium]
MTKNPQQTLCTDTLKLLADFWTLRIIEVIHKNELRYCEIERALETVNPVTLTNRLQKLEAAGIVNRTEEIQDKISVSYSLTTRGREVLPILTALATFSKKISHKT